MAFGKGNNKKQSNYENLYSFKVKTKDLPAPVLEIAKKVGEEWVAQKETADRVSGNIVGVEVRKGSYKGSEIVSTSVTLEDGKDLYFFNFNQGNNLGRGIANRLFNLDVNNLDNVEISVYQSKAKKEGDKTYANGMVRQNDEPVNWKYDRSELPEIKTAKVGNKVVFDSSELDAFYIGALEELGKAIKAARAGSNPKTPAPAKSETDDEGAESSDEKVPF